MNSMIISSLIVLFKNIKEKFVNSKTGQILSGIYMAFSRGWNNSTIINLIGNTDRKKTIDKSIVYKLFHLPFTFFEFLNSKIGEYLNKKIKTSFICDIGRTYLHNFMALNTS